MYHLSFVIRYAHYICVAGFPCRDCMCPCLSYVDESHNVQCVKVRGLRQDRRARSRKQSRWCLNNGSNDALYVCWVPGVDCVGLSYMFCSILVCSQCPQQVGSALLGSSIYVSDMFNTNLCLCSGVFSRCLS